MARGRIVVEYCPQTGNKEAILKKVHHQQLAKARQVLAVLADVYPEEECVTNAYGYLAEAINFITPPARPDSADDGVSGD